MTWNEARVGLVVIACLVLFGRGVAHQPDCRPHPEAAEGWEQPVAIAVDGHVVEWHPNTAKAVYEAHRVAYNHPKQRVRVASIHEMVFRLKDGTPCTYRSETDHEAVSRSTRNVGVPGGRSGSGGHEGFRSD